MALYKNLLFVLTLFILVMASCTKPVLIGSDFLEDEKANLKFADTFSLSFFTEKTDSVLVHSNNISRQLITYLCGELNDPFFGKTRAEIYAQPLLPTVATELIQATLDSVVLELRYDTLGSYGSMSDPVTIEVYRMLERPDFNTKYYSNQKFQTSTELLGSLTFLPRPKDSVTVNRGDTVTLAPHVRIPLNTLLLSDLPLQDSIIYTNLDSFLNYFKGLYIKMSDNSNTMLGFNLTNAVSGLSIFYTKGDIINQEFKLAFTVISVKTVYMEHEYAGTMVDAALTPDPENDYFFLQGLSGVTTKMNIGGLSDLGNAIINEAELEFYCSFPDGDNPEFYPPCPYVVTQYATDTSLNNSLDVTIALVRTSGDYTSLSYETLYGGNLSQKEAGPPVIYRYNMKVTSQVKDIYKGDKENVIYFNPIDKGNVPGRSIIFGPGHPLYPPRLRVYYTCLDSDCN